jgi:hypothetical protein
MNYLHADSCSHFVFRYVQDRNQAAGTMREKSKAGSAVYADKTPNPTIFPNAKPPPASPLASGYLRTDRLVLYADATLSSLRATYDTSVALLPAEHFHFSWTRSGQLRVMGRCVTHNTTHVYLAECYAHNPYQVRDIMPLPIHTYHKEWIYILDVTHQTHIIMLDFTANTREHTRAIFEHFVLHNNYMG